MNRSFAYDKSKYTEVFNRAFRRGANERAGLGLQRAGDLKPPGSIPEPATPLKGIELVAWEKGFTVGFQIGASDAELASVEVPGACGMISGFDQEFLEQFGFFATAE